MRDRTLSSAELLRQACLSGANERDALLHELRQHGLSDQQARKAMNNALQNRVLERHIDSDGHTTYLVAARVQFPSAGRPSARTRPARRARRRTTKTTSVAPVETKATAANAPAAPAQPAAFALYSTGALAIEYGGQVLCVLPPEDTHLLIRYLVTQRTLVEQIFEGVPS